MRSLLGAVIALLALPATTSAESKKEFALYGIGTSTCAQFADLYKLGLKQNELLYFSWAQGLLSGINISQMRDRKTFRDLNTIDVEAQEKSIRAYCDEHPLADYLEAVFDLAKKMPIKQAD